MSERFTTKSEIVAVVLEDGAEVRRYRTTNFLTELGEAHIADQLSDSGQSAMSHMAIGDDSGQTAASTTLANELARVALDATYPKQGTGASDTVLGRVVRDNEVLYRGTFAAGTGTGTITEFAVLNNSSGGTMLNYAEPSPAWVKGAGQELIIVMALTIGAS